MCDTVVIVEPDRVWLAKNSDRDANEAQVLERHPAAEHPAGASLTCTWVTIPQARRTHATLISRPFWMWGAEMGSNEHGVVIGNEAVFTRAAVPRVGLTGMDLLRLALERAASAAEAVELIPALAAEHGQGGGCGHEDRSFRYHSSYLIADASGAFVLESAGPDWAVERVTGVRSISNGLTIPGFAERHANRLYGTVAACRTRRARTQTLGAAATSATDLFALLRDHGEGRAAPHYSPLNGAMRAPCMHAGGLVTASQTTASWVSELTPRGASHWATGTSAPCTSLFKPVSLDMEVDLGAPTDVADDSLWWRHERLHRLVMREPEGRLARYTTERDAIEARWAASPPAPEQAFAEGDQLLARWLADQAAPGRDLRPGFARRYWRVRDRRAGLRD